MKNAVVMGFLGRFTLLLLIVIFISMFMGSLSFPVSFNDSAASFSAFFAAVPASMSSSSSSSRPGYVIPVCVAIMMILTWNRDRTHHLAGSLQVNQPSDDDEVYCQSATEVGKKMEGDHVSDQRFEQPPETEPGIYINEMQGRDEETVTKICSREMHESKEKEEEVVVVDEHESKEKEEEEVVVDEHESKEKEEEEEVVVDEHESKEKEEEEVVVVDEHESKEKEEEEVVVDELEWAIPADDLRMKCEDFIAKFREDLRLQRQPADDLRMKCEDFIAKFREDLRLQRQLLHLES